MTGFYHLSVNVIGRSKGRSAVACSAYRSGEVIYDRRYGKTHDYRERRGIMCSGVLAPDSAPSWARERTTLWNALESFEKRKDAQLAREFVLGLSHRLNRFQHRQLVEEFIKRELLPSGLVADWAIHAPNRKGDERNYHAHVMVTVRSVGPDGFDAKKDRSLNSPEQLMKWREAWAEIQNLAFQRWRIAGDDGGPLRVDHRSHEERGLELEPTQHLGVHATAMERKGMRTELGDHNRRVRDDNQRKARLERNRRMKDALEIQVRKIQEERSQGRDREGPALD